MGNCTSGASGGARGSGSALDKAIQRANAPIIETKAGASFQNLPQSLKDTISRNMQITQFMQDDLKNDHRYQSQDEWNVQMHGDKEKRKLITTYNNGMFEYTLKKGNKILLKTNNKNQAANKVAEFLQSRRKARGII